MAMICKVRRMHFHQGKSVPEKVRLTSLLCNPVRKWLKTPLIDAAPASACRLQRYSAATCCVTLPKAMRSCSSRTGSSRSRRQRRSS